jgi:Flp pilus assembly pilin Flp
MQPPTPTTRSSRRVARTRDAGATTVEYLGWAAMSTVAIVAIGAALQVLGST